MNATHLTIYREDGLFFVDEDLPDNPDGARSPGSSGWHFSTPQEAGAFVVEWLTKNRQEP